MNIDIQKLINVDSEIKVNTPVITEAENSQELILALMDELNRVDTEEYLRICAANYKSLVIHFRDGFSTDSWLAGYEGRRIITEICEYLSDLAPDGYRFCHNPDSKKINYGYWDIA